MADIKLKTLKFPGSDNIYKIPESVMDEVTSVTVNNFLVGNGTEAMVEKTPNEVLRMIGAIHTGEFGLGSNVTHMSDPNSIYENGFYSIEALEPSTGITANWYCIHIEYNTGTTGRYATQIAFGMYDATNIADGSVKKRYKVKDVWSEWEYVNPPFTPDVEYRTTERRNGHVVIKRLNSATGKIEFKLSGESVWQNYAETLGAAPSGYGLGESIPMSVGDTLVALNSIANTGFYRWYNKEDSSIDYGWYYGTFIDYGNDDGFMRMKKYGSTFEICRSKISGVWQGWVKCDPSAFAPSGFGLGAASCTAPPDNDANNAVYNGLYSVYASTANAPGIDGVLAVESRAYGQTYQTIKQHGTGCVVQRCQKSGVWQEWEWVNPPMTADREYRTTERYNGKPVYVKTFSASFNSISAAGTVKDLLIPHGLPNHYIVRVEATAGTYMFPSILDRDSFTSIYTVDATNITIRICDDSWNGSIRFTLYYTKD